LDNPILFLNAPGGDIARRRGYRRDELVGMIYRLP
jgi:hypothetical protein